MSLEIQMFVLIMVFVSLILICDKIRCIRLDKKINYNKKLERIRLAKEIEKRQKRQG